MQYCVQNLRISVVLCLKTDLCRGIEVYITYTFSTMVLLSTLFGEISAVNSPQMTFFTPPSHDGIIHLESKYGYSATLKLTRESMKTAREEQSSNEFFGGDNTMAKAVRKFEYLILGPDYPFHGVSAVIQEMNLRESTDGSNCRDFVQFSVNASKGSQTNQICGKLSREDWTENLTGSRSQRSYFSPGGTIHLYFYSDILDDVPEYVENDQTSLDTIEDNVGIEIVFTSYTVCPNPANSWKKLKTCSQRETMSCIYSTLFCDSKVDCGFPGEYGIDEEGCYIPYIYMSISIIASITITASLIYLFVRWVTKVPKEYQ